MLLLHLVIPLLFRKINSWLKDNGKLFVHTEPNKIFNDIFYKYYSYPIGNSLIFISNILSNSTYPYLIKPRNIRTKLQRQLHVNEPTYINLKNLFDKTGFEGKILSSGVVILKPVNSWKDILFNFIVYLHPISNVVPFNIFFGNDFYSTLTKRKNLMSNN